VASNDQLEAHHPDQAFTLPDEKANPQWILIVIYKATIPPT